MLTLVEHNILIMILILHLAVMTMTSAIWFLIFLTVGFQHVRSNSITLEQPYRTAFHFQPPQNWMNGNLFFFFQNFDCFFFL
ncbi:putative beta-fructofuranosidase [Helianthus debilis subsp. tardiflorus]